MTEVWLLISDAPWDEDQTYVEGVYSTKDKAEWEIDRLVKLGAKKSYYYLRKYIVDPQHD